MLLAHLKASEPSFSPSVALKQPPPEFFPSSADELASAVNSTEAAETS